MPARFLDYMMYADIGLALATLNIRKGHFWQLANERDAFILKLSNRKQSSEHTGAQSTADTG